MPKLFLSVPLSAVPKLFLSVLSAVPRLFLSFRSAVPKLFLSMLLSAVPKLFLSPLLAAKVEETPVVIYIAAISINFFIVFL